MERVGQAALIASVGGTRGSADWNNPDHRLRRLLAEFIAMAGPTFILSGGAAILARYGGHGLQRWRVVLALSLVSALRLVVAVYFLGDISAHFNPVTTLAFALRRDRGWVMALVCWIVQFVAAACGSPLANGPKLNGPFVPLAVGAYIMAWGTMGGPFEGASMNPARSFGPDLALGTRLPGGST
jgi:aquaporin Z